MDETRGVRTIRVDGVCVVALHGEHDISTSDALRRTLDGVFEDGSHVVVDVSDATFLDSTTLTTILVSHERAGDGRPPMVLVAPLGGEPRRLIDLVAIGRLVRLFGDRELAVSALTNQPTMFTPVPASARARR